MDNASGSASSEPQPDKTPDKTPAKRRVRFRVPDDCYEHGQLCVYCLLFRDYPFASTELPHLKASNHVTYNDKLNLSLFFFFCRCWWWRLLPAALPALPGYRGDQFGWHCPLLCSGGCPVISLSGLLQKCRLLHWPVTAWDSSHPALVHSWVIAANSSSQGWNHWFYCLIPAVPAAALNKVFLGDGARQMLQSLSLFGASGYYAAKLAKQLYHLCLLFQNLLNWILNAL